VVASLRGEPPAADPARAGPAGCGRPPLIAHRLGGALRQSQVSPRPRGI
jgi:hypothetical protein